MKEYNCPDCNLNITTCYGCPRASTKLNTNTIEENNNILLSKLYEYDPCVNCPNKPQNGEIKFCNCILKTPQIMC